MISEQEKAALFTEVHRAIEEAAASAAAAVRSQEVQLSYPPNAGFSPAEQRALASFPAAPEAESALRKIIADAASVPLFRLFCLFDAVGAPEDYEDVWLGLSLNTPDDDDEEPDTMLHDEFFDSYWKWRERRPDPGWKLDTYQG
ncbi:MAG TPA: hypothetical protein VD930_09070 [Gemmatimonadales bacterium]|nr:hypothetical protein [Gemmatimonadales bacterium]